MLIIKEYDEETKTEKAWFNSSMVIYTRMVEHENENKGELYITYKGGSTYLYHDVKFEDYVVFIGGGTDGSHGKTINKIIKGQYEFEKVGTLDVGEITKECTAAEERKRKASLALENDFNAKYQTLYLKAENLYLTMKKEIEESDEISEAQYNEIINSIRTIFNNIL